MVLIGNGFDAVVLMANHEDSDYHKITMFDMKIYAEGPAQDCPDSSDSNTCIC